MNPQVAGPESIHCVVDDDLLEKLKLTFPEEQPGGCSQWKTSCCNVKSLLKCVGALLAFYLANVAVVLAGVIAVVDFLVGLLAVAILLAGLNTALWLTSRFPRSFGDYGYAVLGVLYVAVWLVALVSIHACAALHFLVMLGLSGMFLLSIALQLIFNLVWLDVHLANYFSSAVSFDLAPEKVPQPDDCAERFEDDALCQPYDLPPLLPVIAVSIHLWVAVLYFGVCKVLVVGLSAVSIFYSVIQPAISVLSGGDAPIFSMTFHSDPIVYVVVVISSCMAGGVGLVLVAALSVKLTWRVFGESVAEEEQMPATPA